MTLIGILVISCQKEAVKSTNQKLTLEEISSSRRNNTSTFKIESVKDIDKNTYKIITIGRQKWIASNLNTSKYRNGEPIPEMKDPAKWSQLTTGAWCYYNNDSTNYAKYGKLYNWYALNDPRGLAPKGWHIPSDAEWINLGTYLGGDALAGGKMKELGTLNWLSPNEGATNESGFSGLPGGSRDFDSGMFPNVRLDGSWWSSSIITNSNNPIIRTLFYDASYLDSWWGRKQNGYSVRCIRD